VSPGDCDWVLPEERLLTAGNLSTLDAKLLFPEVAAPTELDQEFRSLLPVFLCQVELKLFFINKFL